MRVFGFLITTHAGSWLHLVKIQIQRYFEQNYQGLQIHNDSGKMQEVYWSRREIICTKFCWRTQTACWFLCVWKQAFYSWRYVFGTHILLFSSFLMYSTTLAGIQQWAGTRAPRRRDATLHEVAEAVNEILNSSRRYIKLVNNVHRVLLLNAQ